MSRFQKIRSYAHRLYDAIRRFVDVLREIFLNFGRFIRNLFWIVVTTLQRGLTILRIYVIDFVKAFIRAVIDILRWPLERFILPLSRWLANRTDVILDLIQTHDEIALGLFVGLLILIGLSCYILIRLV